jgi:hypothetical protein
MKQGRGNARMINWHVLTLMIIFMMVWPATRLIIWLINYFADRRGQSKKNSPIGEKGEPKDDNSN